MKPFISLCMIVKNEEKVIDRCLSSIAHLVQEIIVVDTGSTDNTKKIVKKYTSHIYDYEWTNDFSAARNFAAKKATGDWILVLDADEYVDEDNFKDFIQELKNDDDKFNAYGVNILNFMGVDGESLAKNHHDRVYKNNGEIKYYRKIHEQFQHVNEEELNIKVASLLIFHSGYLNKVVNEKKKNERNREILNIEFDSKKTKGFDYFNLGNEYASVGDYAKALGYYLEAYKRKESNNLSWVSASLIQIIVCLMNLKRYKDALNVIQDAEDIYQEFAEVAFLKGEIYFLRGQREKAKSVFHQIVANPNKYNHVILRPDLKDQKPHLRLGQIYLQEENNEQAIFHYSNVLNINRLNRDAIYNVVDILNKFHSSLEIAEFLKAKNLINTKNINNYVNVCLNLGNTDLALMLLEDFKKDNQLLYKVSLLKKSCIHGEVSPNEFLDLLNHSVLKDLNLSNWISIVDIYLLNENFSTHSQVSAVMKHFISDELFKHFEALLQNNTFEGKVNEEVFLSSLQILLNYKHLEFCQIFLDKVDLLSNKGKSKVANLLFTFGLKGQALQLYDLCNWNDFEEIDFLNIMNGLTEASDIIHANDVALYAVSINAEDYRFYEFALKHSKDYSAKENIRRMIKEKFEVIDFSNSYNTINK
ncbi:tetratricopeptide repeat-containing glycosyltransferase family 2 protein [Priestia koreensis]|uniref:tetratricopeptide repeat-containing glycosyltransferase family 2 protein n=2 Tax=Bacteria TaxID=2 RepID=UPI00345A21D9